MLRQRFIYFLLLLSNLSSELYGYATPFYDNCLNPSRLTLEHIEGKGLGYDCGYSSLNGFFAPDPTCSSTLPFVDLRTHIFNDGKFAANAGIGIRSLVGSRIYGVNAYYDYRHAKRTHYNQIGLGFEALGIKWDFRLNGYLPIGTKTRALNRSINFDSFRGRLAFLSERIRTHAAMSGVDAEAAFHISKNENFDLYAAAGPYYYRHHHRHAFGGRVRVGAKFLKYFSIEAINTYDNRFHDLAQGRISINIPFGPSFTIPNQSYASSNYPAVNDTFMACNDLAILRERLVQNVERQEIIVQDKYHKTNFFPAIDPLTGSPYIFWFVNNTSPLSLGTFENPFNTLAAAQNASAPNDIVYIYPGDGTSKGMNSGFILKNNQKLWGAGINQTLVTTSGTVIVPLMAFGKPLITSASSPMIIAANNNEISGIHLVTNQNARGIQAANVTNLSIHDNTIDATVNPAIFDSTSGTITLDLVGGQTQIFNNTFNLTNPVFPTSGNPLFGVHILSTVAGADYFITNNHFLSTPESSTSGIEFGTSGNALTDFHSIVISNNVFDGLGAAPGFGAAISGFGFGGTGHLIIDHNSFSRLDTFATAPVMIQVRSGGHLSATITNNNWTSSENIAKPSLNVKLTSAISSVCLTLKNNKSDTTPKSYILDNTIAGSFTADISGNTGNIQELGVITTGTCP